MLSIWASIGRWAVLTIRMPGDVQDVRIKVERLEEMTARIDQRVTDLNNQLDNDLKHIKEEVTTLLEETIISRTREEHFSTLLKELAAEVQNGR